MYNFYQCLGIEEARSQDPDRGSACRLLRCSQAEQIHRMACPGSLVKCRYRLRDRDIRATTRLRNFATRARRSGSAGRATHCKGFRTTVHHSGSSNKIPMKERTQRYIYKGKTEANKSSLVWVPYVEKSKVHEVGPAEFKITRQTGYEFYIQK